MSQRPEPDADVSGLLPRPPEMPSRELGATSTGRRLLIAAAGIVVLAGLHFAEPFIVPVVMGVMVAAVSSPLVTWLVRKGAPPVLGAAAVLVIDVGVLGGIARLLLLAASDLQDGMPAYIAKLSELGQFIQHYLDRKGLHEMAGGSLIHSVQVGPILQGMVGNFADIASRIAVVVFVVFFGLCEISGMGDKLRLLTSNAEAQFERVDRIVRQVQLYLLVKFWTSLIAGVCAFVLLKLVGVHLALLLALSLFLLHFIPNIGTAIATVPAVLLALADKGPAAALEVGVAYLMINTLIGNLLEPRMLGKSLGISPFVVLLGMLFWAFMWGPIGALLSVPILVATKIVVENIPDLAWLGVLAGGAPESPLAAVLPRSARRQPTLGLGLGALERIEPRTPKETSPGFRVREPSASTGTSSSVKPVKPVKPVIKE